jgi:alkylation response protein AidB-like acyl-CoA dehydrogenase
MTEPADERDLDAFRRSARAFLEKHASPCRAADDSAAGDSSEVSDAESNLEARAFQARLHDAGLAGITFPKEYGGAGLSAFHQRVFNEEAVNFVLPSGRLLVSLGMCAPAVLGHGTEAQRRRHLPRMLRGEEVWCQLFSEPDAGSDVASLRTTAVAEPGGWAINGQKVWTSGAHLADFGLLLARTNPRVPKHHGISAFVVDMRAAGVTVRPLRQMTGESRFNEVFFHDAHVPSESLIGDIDGGWRVAIATLMNERVSIGAGGGGSGRRYGGGESRRLIQLAQRLGRNDDSVTRQELARVSCLERIVELLALRTQTAVRVGRAPGPEGSVAKLATVRLTAFAANLGVELAGLGGQAWDPDEKGGAWWARTALAAPGSSIAGGTSEILRNVIGERVLGLPKEPQIDRDVPFHDLVARHVAGAELTQSATAESA